MCVIFMMVVWREFYTDDGVMLDSLRPSPASFGQRKRRTKGRKGDAFLGPGARRKGEPYAQVRSIKRIWLNYVASPFRCAASSLLAGFSTESYL